MITKTIQFTLLAAAIYGVTPNARAEGKHLFILSGQSNMARFNENATFIPAVEAEFEERNVIVVKDAQGGKPIRHWYKAWEAPTPGKKNQEIGDLYNRLMAKVRKATRDQDIETVTVLWMQGEQDAREATGTLYRPSLEGLFRQFETDLGRKDLNFVVGRLSDFGIGNDDWPHWESIRKSQQELAEASPRIAWVNTDDLNDGTNRKGETVQNELHYTKDGYRFFGERLAEAAISLIKNQRKDSSQAELTPREHQPRNSFPSVEELPPEDKLQDPFQFFGSDRRVKTREDWEQRQAEMMDMLEHYIYGPAFPQVNKYKVESRTEQPLAGGNVVKYTADLKLGPDLSHPVTVKYYLIKNKERNSILIYVVAREEPQDEDAIEFAKRGYAYTALKVGPYEKIARRVYPDIQGTRTMAWVWGMNEMINYLTHEHKIDKVILTGCSRYGRVALLTGALNKRVDLTAPITTLAHAVHHFDETMWGPGNVKWGNQVYNTFAGKMNRLPVDRHFLGAVIAPRAYLGIMGAEKPAFNEGHVEAYEALVPVYEWLGARKNLGLYDHSPRGHGVNLDDLHTVLDFADQIFYGKKPASGKAFDQISNPDLVGFEWKAPARISVK